MNEPGDQLVTRPASFPGPAAAGIYFVLWYLFNVVYNIFTKSALVEFPYPITLTTIQMLIGSSFVSILWAVKPSRINSRFFMWPWLQIGTCHALGAVGTQYSFFLGSVGLTNVLKSAEPLFSAGFTYVILSKSLTWKIYCSLLVIIFGIALASIEDATFSWPSFIWCNVANVFYPLRMVLSKKRMPDDSKFRLSPEELYRAVTIAATLLVVPFSLVELLTVDASAANILSQLYRKSVMRNVALSGTAYYIYNEVNFTI
jgi:solute carrier family 35 protein E1